MLIQGFEISDSPSTPSGSTPNWIWCHEHQSSQELSSYSCSVLLQDWTPVRTKNISWSIYWMLCKLLSFCMTSVRENISDKPAYKVSCQCMQQNKGYYYSIIIQFFAIRMTLSSHMRNNYRNERRCSISVSVSLFLTSEREKMRKKYEVLSSKRVCSRSSSMSWGKMNLNCIYWNPAEVFFSIKFHIIFQK